MLTVNGFKILFKEFIASDVQLESFSLVHFKHVRLLNLLAASSFG